jgi:hypothetical protein
MMGPLTTGDPFSFRADITDNIALSEVRLHYVMGNPPWEDVNTTMDPMSTVKGQGLYALNITVPTNSTEPLVYRIIVKDTSNNFNITLRQVNVADNDRPEFGPDTSAKVATTGDPLDLRINVKDNVKVGIVRASWWYGTGPANNVSMDAANVDALGVGTYNLTITVASDWDGPLWYQFAVRDPSKLWAASTPVQLNVTDNDVPSVGPDTSHPIGEERYIFEVNVTDNLGIVSVWVEYTIDGGEQVNLTLDPIDVDAGGNGTYGNAELPIPLDKQIRVAYALKAKDGAGNEHSLEDVYVNPDLYLPVFGADSTLGEPVKSKAMTVSVEVTDNFGIKKVTVEYWFGTGDSQNLTMELDGSTFTASIDLPRWPEGDLNYLFRAEDIAGNLNVTQSQTVTLINLLPVIETGISWDVTEGEAEVMDLEPFLSDGNDALTDLVLETTAPGVTIEGLVLSVTYEAWMEDHVIDVNVSDGEDTVVGHIDVTVANVNDLPIITSEPEQTTAVSFAYVYVVEFTDEDANDFHEFFLDDAPAGLEVDQNGRVTWTPALDQEGEHSVDLVLNDGWASVHQRWTIEVAKRPTDEPPAFTNSPPATHMAGEAFSYQAEATDPDGDPLIYYLTEGPDDATLDSDTGLLEWAPPADKRNFAEDVEFVLTVSDGNTDVAMPFTLNLTYPVNLPPEIGEGIETLTIVKDGSKNLAPYMSDPDNENNELHWEVDSDSNRFEARINGNNLVIIPKKDKKGTDTVTLRLIDSWGDEDTFELDVKVDTKVEDSPGFEVIAVLIAMTSVLIVEVSRRKRA